MALLPQSGKVVVSLMDWMSHTVTSRVGYDCSDWSVRVLWCCALIRPIFFLNEKLWKLTRTSDETFYITSTT